MAVHYDSGNNYVVVPTLPKHKAPYIPYTPQQGTNPSDYYAKAWFLPIDTRYMVNTTNKLAYNSMADVLLNKAAQDKRWENTPWMQGVLNPLRIVADTIFYGKDTVLDPMVQGAIDDGWKGFVRGGSTALMNTLVNLGNTLDVVSNPIKGLILDGPEGLVKGLIGDEHGRKQYDYSDYIKTDDGLFNLAASFALELVSDPLNWISGGGKQLISLGADTAAKAATKTIKEAFEGVIEQGVKSIDDLVPKLKGVKYFENISDDAAKSILKNAFGESAEQFTKETLDTFAESTQTLLKKAFSVAELQGGTKASYQKIAQDLLQSEKTRYKASLFSKGVDITPASQKFVSNYLLNAGTTMPDLMGSSINSAVKYGGKMYRGAEAFEKGLRYTAGATGLDEIIGLTKLGVKGAGAVRNAIAKADPNVIKTMNDVFTHLNKNSDTVKKAVEVLESNPQVVTNKALVDTLYDNLAEYQRFLSEQSFSKKSIAKLQAKQKNILKEADALIKELNIENVTTFKDYIKYLSDNNVVLKDNNVSKVIDELSNLNKMLSEDFTDNAVLKKYKNAKMVKINNIEKQIRSQQKTMQHYDKLNREFKRKYSDAQLNELNEHNNILDTNLEIINDQKLLDTLKYKVVPDTLTQLNAEGAHSDIIKTFKQTWDDFLENLEKYSTAPNDLQFKDNLVQSYISLNDQLKSFTKWDTSDVVGGVTATNATQIRNLLGMPYLDNTETVAKSDALEVLLKHGLTEEEALLIIKEAELLQRLYNDPDYKEMLSFYKTNESFVDAGEGSKQAATVLYMRDNILQAYDSDAIKILKQAEEIHTKHPGLPVVDTSPARVYKMTEADAMVLKEADAFLIKLEADSRYKAISKSYFKVTGINLSEALERYGAEAFYMDHPVASWDEQLVKQILDVFPEVEDLLKTSDSYDMGLAVRKYIQTKSEQYIKNKYGDGFLNLLKEAERIKKTVANTPELSKADVTELYHLIEELPTIDRLKSLSTFISPEDMRKYKLVIYSYMHQKNAFLHTQLDLEISNGVKNVTRIHTSTRVTPEFLDKSPNYAKVAGIIDFFRRNNRLNTSYVITVGKTTDLKIDFINDVRRAAEDFLKRNNAHSSVEDWFYYFDYLTLDSVAYSDKTFAIYWKRYNEALADYYLDPNSEAFKIELDNNIYSLKSYLQKNYDVSMLKNLNKQNAALYEQANMLLKMSDNDIKALAKYTETPLYSGTPAHLAEFIAECDRTTSALNHILNDTSIDPNSFDGTIIAETKHLVQRLKEYKALYEYIATTAHSLGFDDTTTEALLDAMRTQLDHKGYITERHLQTVVDEVVDGANLHLQGRFEAPSRALDRVYRQTINTLSAYENLPTNHRAALKRISKRLDEGLAHGAVADVDNLTDLIQLTSSRAITDTRLVGMRKELFRIAAGRNIIVFDIESTGANEAAAHIYQIAGKVLDANGKEIPGSRFNYIIKPPTDVNIKPTGLLLETLATKGENPELWWKNNIVNAVNSDTQKVFNSLDDALKEFEAHCAAQGPFILAGHNIIKYDVPALQSSFLSNADKFDTLKYMNNSIYQIADDPAIIFKKQLTNKLMDLINSNSLLLENKVFTYSDVKTLIQLKELLKDKYSDLFTSSTIKKNNKAVRAARGVGYTEEGVDKNAVDYIRYDNDTAVAAGVGFDLEKTIDGILEAWRAPAKMDKSNTKFFIVSKLNPDDLSETMLTYFKELADKGLINIAPGTNIMQYFNSYVKTGHIVVNPVRVASYEVEEIFDLQKALKVYGSALGFENKLNIKHLAELTRHYKYIQSKRNVLPLDYVKHVKDTAALFLATVSSPHSYISVLRDNVDDLTIVATAQYAYSRLKGSEYLKNLDFDAMLNDIPNLPNKVYVPLEQLGDTWGTVAMLRGYKDYTPTPILNQLDADTRVPKAIWEDERFFSYDKVVDIMKHDPFDEIRAYNIEHNLYNVYDAAKHVFYEALYKDAKEVVAYLDSLDDTQRVASEKALKHYNTALDDAAKLEILTRADRVNALKSEAFARGGYTIFETKDVLDLSDFKADKGFVVLDNIKVSDNSYVHFIIATQETLYATQDLDFVARAIKNVDGIDDTLYDYLLSFRQTLANNGVKNIGYSHGDIIKETYIDTIHAALRRAGVSDDVIATLPSVDDLTSLGFFKTPRANNSIIGGKRLWEYLTNDTDVRVMSDPFKQLLYSAKSGIIPHRDMLIRYCALILNEHSDIATAPIFKDIKPEDLYSLLKKNDDFVMVYITKTGKWDNTKSGLIVKEFNLVNANSIRRAREMGGVHIIPRTQAAQLMKAVNEFELPPIAKIAKAISGVYKVAYLGSLGFIVRNFIDSNYKTYASLDGQVSLPKSLSHFFQSATLVRKHTNIGQEYSAAMKDYFNNDLEYNVFYRFCKQYGDSNLAETIAAGYDVKYRPRIIRQINKLNANFSAETVSKIKPDLIQPELFSIVDAFINHGPSAGLAKTILDNIPKATEDAVVKSTADKVVDGINGFNEWIVKKTPARFVFGFNDTIEQAARLSMFLQRLELGDTIDAANRAIIKTHFDYDDKTIGMLYTEILFPFMSFSYKNLNFWIETMYKNPLLVGQMENIFRPLLNYNSLFAPDQEAYEDYDYTFDWSKDVQSHQTNIPWTMVNAARLYHILNGNVLIKHKDTVMHDAGYGEKENELYSVFKLSPSVLDATKMLFTPLNTYSERLLPPAEALSNGIINMLNGKSDSKQLSITALANMLPYFDTMLQRVGRDENHKLRHNNLYQRIEDAGIQQVLPSLFGAAYVPVKDNVYYYDSDYNILGGFKTNYYAKKNYSNPYNSKYPSYTLTRMAQNKKPRDIYAKSKTNRTYTQQYNQLIRNISDNSLRYRVKDYTHYY